MDPHLQSEDEKFIRMYEALRQCLSTEEWEEIGYIVCFVRQKPVPLFDEVDDLTASTAFAKLPLRD
jgi:hypothetical protein